jgi:hypothetical protein
MKIQKIRQIAKKKNVNFGNVGKIDLIRAIQRAEGNADCFATKAINDCNELNCLWREDCNTALVL